MMFLMCEQRTPRRNDVNMLFRNIYVIVVVVVCLSAHRVHSADHGDG